MALAVTVHSVPIYLLALIHSTHSADLFPDFSTFEVQREDFFIVFKCFRRFKVT